MILFTMFIFIERLRFVLGLNWLLCMLIVEFLIIGLFALSAQTDWKNLLAWFFVCVLFTYLFILIGSVLPQDLTLNVVILFVVAFLFLSITVFMSMMHKIMDVPYSFYAYMILIGLIVLMFVMYHAQTINGGRFAEMRIQDYLLASLILFNDFIILYMLTIYPQVLNKTESSPTTTTAAYYYDDNGYEDDDIEEPAAPVSSTPEPTTRRKTRRPKTTPRSTPSKTRKTPKVTKPRTTRTSKITKPRTTPRSKPTKTKKTTKLRTTSTKATKKTTPPNETTTTDDDWANWG
ncbi:uncharacterized protein LOC117890594 [Drosophila subobscura]|uniref:uncharacterized protein LOC117890594 n=1 Tax=Drosophila subobscura TaxID=7241 RepID=UPI00155AF345|nr:uncharacterized protein LOC117890594 [Drosophila subobscura]